MTINRVPPDIRVWNDPTPPRGGRGPTTNTGAGGRFPSGPGAPGRPIPTQPPFYIEKPRSGTDVYFRETGVLAAGAGSTLDFGVGAIELPQANVGVVAFVTIFVDAPDPTINVTFALLVNGAPVPGWNRLGTFPRTALNLSIVYPGTVHLPAAAKVTGRATNNAATGPWTIGMEVGGWFWPSIDEDEVFGFSIA